MHTLGSITDERAAPLLVHILSHSSHTGASESIYISAIDALGRSGASARGVDMLKDLLHRGEWWAPLRTARIRAAAARALRATGAPSADAVLEDASTTGSRGVRRAAALAMCCPAGRRRQEGPGNGTRPPVACGRRFRAPLRRGGPRRAALLRRRTRSSPRARGARRIAARSCSPTGDVAIGIIGQEIVVGDMPLPQPRNLRRADPPPEVAGHRAHRLRSRRDAGRTRHAGAHNRAPGTPPGETAPRRGAGRCPRGAASACSTSASAAFSLDERVDTSAADIADDPPPVCRAVERGRALWDAAQHEGMPDPTAARAARRQLAQAVAQNRTALVALTALKEYDNYTFTHMVNVSILTMAQARGARHRRRAAPRVRPRRR